MSGASVSLRNLAALEAEDILALNQRVDRPLTLRVNGVEKYEGRIIPLQGRRGFAVNGLLERER
jgi:flagellar motor switch protein FliM